MFVPLQSLRSKLILTFLIVSVAGTLLTTLIVYTSNRRAFDDLLHEQRNAVFVDELEAYYASNGSWADVNASLRGRLQLLHDSEQASASDERPPVLPPEVPPPFIIVDAGNRVVVPNPQYAIGDTVAFDLLSDGFALQVEGEQVGTLILDSEAAAPTTAEAQFLADTNRALLIGALGATAVAIFLAVIIARTLTQPLQELAAASRSLAQGDLQQAVPVRTQDELGELALAFNHMSAELDRLEQIRQQMTADIAHDLRTPLTVLSGYLEAMEDGTLSATPARLRMMRQETTVLHRLVTDLRTLSLADAGQLSLQKEPIAIGELLTQVQASYAHQAAQNHIDLTVDSAESSATLSLDRARMLQSLGNLVSNALRYTPENGRITLSSASQTNGSVEISIADTGAGIPSDDLPNIFNRFYRGDRSRHEGQGSSGLGLAITKSLIAAHGGDISVQSTLGRGTTFTISLQSG